jgi:hypothetical protein
MLRDLIKQAAIANGLDEALLTRLIMAESSGNPNAVSPKGAQGLGQLMPGTAREMGVTNAFDPAQNVNASAGYLAKLRGQFGGDLNKAVAAYNWGPGNLSRAGGNVNAAPPETLKYLNRVMQPAPGQEPLPPEPPPEAPPAAPEAAPGGLPPSQLTNDQRMRREMPPGRGSLAGLLAGVAGSVPGVAAPAPITLGRRPGFGLV